jgi:recombination associated protein RdgC
MFKNLKAFRLDQGWAITVGELCERLGTRAFQGCGSQDMQASGWVSPRDDGALAHAVNGQILLCLRTEERILPSAVVRRETSARAKEIEKSQGAKPGRKQLREIKDQVIQDLLPRAFLKERDTAVWLDRTHGWLVIEGGASRADDVLACLHQAVGDVPVTALRTTVSPGAAMRSWLENGEAPNGFSIDQDCELRSPEKATVRYAHHSLAGDDVRQHLASGKQPTKLGLTWKDRVSFVLDQSFEIKKVEMLDVVVAESAAGGADGKDDIADADFVIATGELSQVLGALVTAHGGPAA